MSVNRYSSRREALDESFLRQRLAGAKRYLRIAGYFRSSILELAGEELSGVDEIRVVCNSEVDFGDVAIAKRAQEQALRERWGRDADSTGLLLHKQRYQRLHELLVSGRMRVRVVPKSDLFLHGKAGIIETRDGTKTSFVGSANETRSGFGHNYEIIWEDASPEAVAWVEDEFDALWNHEHAIDLPDVIITEIGRLAARQELPLEALLPGEVPGAVLAETPMYAAGQILQPWQQAFVSTFMEHRETYGKARLLLADEVGLGKTLSLGASAVISSVLGDGPTLILCPATLTRQWQGELLDRLGAPSAVWSSTRKCWIDPTGHIIPTRGAGDVVKAPYQIAIVSTGLVTNNSAEVEALLAGRYGMVILDEAHKARRTRPITGDGQPNNLLQFMLKLGVRSRHILLGTATPIQTSPGDLWDLMEILGVGTTAVLGSIGSSRWRSGWQASHPMITNTTRPADAREMWEWLRNPLAPSTEAHDGGLAAQIRQQQDIGPTVYVVDTPLHDLDPFVQQDIEIAADTRRSPVSVLSMSNPVLRHSVLRRRDTLEEQGLLDRVGVELHPLTGRQYPGVPFSDRSLRTHPNFISAYEAAEQYCASIRRRNPGAGFMKTLMLQRLCSSVAAGVATAQRLIDRQPLASDEADELEEMTAQAAVEEVTPQEIELLRTVIRDLTDMGDRDPKLTAVHQFLLPQAAGGLSWLQHGCIVFSQYYDTAAWIAKSLSNRFPEESVALYTSAARSGVWRAGEFATANRNDLKRAVQDRALRLVVATDAACEGLNLQMLGTLINVDLPWNPSRVEQRLGRIKRFGQLRASVDVLNLSYDGTQDQRIHNVLSERFKDIFDTFGGLTEAIDTDWIEREEELRERVDTYISERKEHANPFDIRYTTGAVEEADQWSQCAKVLSRPDVDDRLRRPW